jgi:hypothetical protein
MKAISRRAVVATIPIAAAGASLPTIAAAVAAPLMPANPDEALLRLDKRWFAADAKRDRLSEMIEAAYEKAQPEQPDPNPMPEALRVRAEDHDLGIVDQSPSHQHFMAEQITEHFVAEQITGARKRTAKPPTCPEHYDNQIWIDHLRKPRWGVVEKREMADDVQPYYCCGMVDVRCAVKPSPAARARADEIVQAFDEWRSRNRTEDPDPPGVEAMEHKKEVLFDLMCDLEKRIFATPARTLAGLVAKARHALRDDVTGCMDDYGERIVTSLAQDVIDLANNG